MVSLEGVSKIFKMQERSFTALKNVSLQIDKGAYVAIIGKSGSGKSTLLNMITGIDHPSEGKIKLIGTEISGMSESKLARWRGQNIGIVFQFFQLIPTLTIQENLLLAMELVGSIPKEERLARAKHLLAQVELSDQEDKMPALLSGGEQQRAAIARALANDPSLIVADEPTGNLDSKTAASIHALLASLSRSGKTVIVVTHEKEATTRYDRCITLSDGQIISNTGKIATS